MQDVNKRKKFYRELCKKDYSGRELLIDKIIELEDSNFELKLAYHELLVFLKRHSVCVPNLYVF